MPKTSVKENENGYRITKSRNEFFKMDLLQNYRKCSLCTLQQSKLVVKSDSIACRSYDGSYGLFQFSKNSNSNLQHSFEMILRMDLLMLRSLYLTFKTIGYNGLKYGVSSEFLKLLSSLIFWSAKQKNGSSSQNDQHTQGNQQFVIYPNKLTNLSRQVELVGSDEQKFEGFKILNNNVLNDVQIRPNNNPMSFRPTNHKTLCSPFTQFVTYHVNLLTGKFSKQFWLAMFRVIDVASLQLERTHQIFLFTEYKIQSHTNSTPKLNNSEASTRHLYYKYLQSLVMLLLMQMNSVQFKFNI
ncbi:Hypothetical_protein [Hexamita inflata]|uniref:Hypothetical_protein n=1 Tax=Hexamita inflata TaxID=28002 RepID=A0AA86U939_9EUKA|nr:Hypothetical protein HINF_LOCUS29852 [Hexamita inflata]